MEVCAARGSSVIEFGWRKGARVGAARAVLDQGGGSRRRISAAGWAGGRRRERNAGPGQYGAAGRQAAQAGEVAFAGKAHARAVRRSSRREEGHALPGASHSAGHLISDVARRLFLAVPGAACRLQPLHRLTPSPTGGRPGWGPSGGEECGGASPHLQCALRLASRSRCAGSPQAARKPRFAPNPPAGKEQRDVSPARTASACRRVRSRRRCAAARSRRRAGCRSRSGGSRLRRGRRRSRSAGA